MGVPIVNYKKIDPWKYIIPCRDDDNFDRAIQPWLINPIVYAVESNSEISEESEELLTDSKEDKLIWLYVSKRHCQIVNIGTDKEEKNFQILKCLDPKEFSFVIHLHFKPNPSSKVPLFVLIFYNYLFNYF